MSYDIQQSTTQAPLLFLMVLSSDHLSPATGLAPTVTLSKAGGAFAACAGAVTEIANGWYKVAGNATDTNTLGPLALHATVATADASDLVVANIVAFNPQDAVRQGLTALPNVVVGTAGGLPTTGTGANQINVSGGVVDANTKNVTGAAIMTGTARTSASNTTTALALPAGWNSPGNINAGDKLEFFAGTGAGESGIALSFSGLGTSTPVVNTIPSGWSGGVTPDGTTQFRVVPGYGLIPIDGSTLASATQVGAIQATTSQLGFDAQSNVKATMMGVNGEPWIGNKPYNVAT